MLLLGRGRKDTGMSFPHLGAKARTPLGQLGEKMTSPDPV